MMKIFRPYSKIKDDSARDILLTRKFIVAKQICTTAGLSMKDSIAPNREAYT